MVSLDAVLVSCHGCGIQKDTVVKEFYTVDDRLTKDEPIAPLLVLCCEPSVANADWRHAVVCHACFARLDPDMWISQECWEDISPAVPFANLPLHTEETCGNDTPEAFA
jgi:hypothetical protein